MANNKDKAEINQEVESVTTEILIMDLKEETEERSKDQDREIEAEVTHTTVEREDIEDKDLVQKTTHLITIVEDNTEERDMGGQGLHGLGHVLILISNATDTAAEEVVNMK